MTVRVRLFASLVDRAGTPVVDVALAPEGRRDVSAVWDALVARHSGLGEVGFKPMAALDRVYVDWDTPVDGAEEVAFLPPVSGG